MRHTFLILAASTFLTVLAGCACNQCSSCRSNAGACQQPQQAAAAGGQAGQGGTVSYPYYTMRGPAISWKRIRRVSVRGGLMPFCEKRMKNGCVHRGDMLRVLSRYQGRPW